MAFTNLAEQGGSSDNGGGMVFSTTPLIVETVEVLKLFDVKKDNYLRKNGALVVDKQSGEKKILIRLNCQDFKNETHRQALVKVVTFMTSQHRMPCLVLYERFLRDGDDFYLVQQNYQYGRFKDLVQVAKQKGKPLAEQYIKNWLAHLLVAVNALHDRKVPHNNIVMSNIFVDEKCLHLGPTEGFCRILDHPRSFAGTQAPPRPDPERDAEKLEYIAPEVVGSKLPGFPLDVWCVGIVAYYVGAMKYPFHDENPDNIPSNVLRKQPDYNVLVKNGYSQGLKEFIVKCLDKNPEKRCRLTDLVHMPYIMDDVLKVRAKIS